MNASAAELEALRLLARLVAREVVAELRAGDVPGMVDQSRSGLGRRRHIAYARRLLAAGDSRAVQLGRRFLLTADAVEEARRHYSERTARRRTEYQDEDDQLARELGLSGRANDA